MLLFITIELSEVYDENQQNLSTFYQGIVKESGKHLISTRKLFLQLTTESPSLPDSYRMQIKLKKYHEILIITFLHHALTFPAHIVCQYQLGPSQ